MSETNPFFRWLYRGLALSALAMVLLVGYSTIVSMWNTNDWQRNRTVDVPDADSPSGVERRRLTFNNLTELAGTSMRTVDVGAQRSGRVVMSSGGYGGFETHNLVFLPQGNGDAKWLFPNNNQEINQKKTICACGEDADAPAIAIFMLVSRDNNGDGDIDESDAVVPTLVKPDGTGVTELMPVARVLDTDVGNDGSSIGILCEVEGALVYREFASGDFRMISQRIVTKIL